MINKNLQEKLNALIQKTVMEEGKLEEDLNFFHNNKANQQQQQKKKPTKKRKNMSLKPYSTTRFKVRKFLTTFPIMASLKKTFLIKIMGLT